MELIKKVIGLQKSFMQLVAFLALLVTIVFIIIIFNFPYNMDKWVYITMIFTCYIILNVFLFRALNKGFKERDSVLKLLMKKIEKEDKNSNL